MSPTLTALGILTILAGWPQPEVLHAAAAGDAVLYAEPASPFASQAPAGATAMTFKETARAQVSYTNLNSRLTTTRKQLDDEETLLRRALLAAQQAARDAENGTRNAASASDRMVAAAQLKQANDLIAQLTVRLQSVAQRKQEVSSLVLRASPSIVSNVKVAPVPKDLSDSMVEIEAKARQSSLDTEHTAQMAFSLQTPAVVTSAAPTPPPVPPQGVAPQANPSPPPSPPTVAPGSDGGGSSPSPLAPQVAKWFAQLQKGALQYKVPTTMYWKESSTVTVVIQGPGADASSALQGATGSGALKVSDRMRVVLSCPDNPDEFIINREQGTEEIQFVPENSATTWNWSVTPKYTGKSQKLSVAAWVLYPGQDDKVLQELPVYTAHIDVHIPGFGESLKRLIEGDPDYWLRYGLPGGGGFIFVAGALAGLRKWMKSRAAKSDKPVASAAK